LTGDLEANSTQLNTATRAVAAALQQQSAYGPAIKEALANVEREASTHCQELIRNIPTAFQRLEASRLASDRGLAFLLGTVVSSRTDMRSVKDQIMTVNKDQLGFSAAATPGVGKAAVAADLGLRNLAPFQEVNSWG
jgi:hypothetical protein